MVKLSSGSKKKDQKSQIVLSCHQTKENNTFLNGQIIVRNLKKMKTFAKNDPYYEISWLSNNGSGTVYTPVYRFEVKKKCSGSIFKPFLIPFQALFPDNNQSRLIKISFYDYSSRKPPKLIFECTRSLHDFINSHGKNIFFSKLEIVRIPTFADYLKNGVQMKMITAIDFSDTKKSSHITSNKHDMILINVKKSTVHFFISHFLNTIVKLTITFDHLKQ